MQTTVDHNSGILHPLVEWAINRRRLMSSSEVCTSVPSRLHSSDACFWHSLGSIHWFNGRMTMYSYPNCSSMFSSVFNTLANMTIICYYQTDSHAELKTLSFLFYILTLTLNDLLGLLWFEWELKWQQQEGHEKTLKSDTNSTRHAHAQSQVWVDSILTPSLWEEQRELRATLKGFQPTIRVSVARIKRKL